MVSLLVLSKYWGGLGAREFAIYITLAGPIFLIFFSP